MNTRQCVDELIVSFETGWHVLSRTELAVTFYLHDCIYIHILYICIHIYIYILLLISIETV
jgi:hypothetical protein